MMVSPPNAFIYEGKPFWVEDPYDEILPSGPGLINDFVLSLRGTETPVAFSLWSIITATAVAIKRESWLTWLEGAPLYPNFYTILVGPAGSKKGVAIGNVLEVLSHFQRYVEPFHLRQRKDIKMYQDQVTREGIMATLPKRSSGYTILHDSEGRALVNDNGSPRRYKNTAEVFLVAEELGTLLSRAKYNEDLITFLTSLYNTKSEHEETTVKRKKCVLHNLCTSLLGGTTPDAFRESIPHAAVNEGFLSRTVICYQTRKYQCFPFPKYVGVSKEDLSVRLAWVVSSTLGEWELSKSAKATYTHWYLTLDRKFDEGTFHEAQRARIDIIILKLAHIIAAQRYEAERGVVNAVDVREATAIVEKTFAQARGLIDEVGAPPEVKEEHKVLDYIARHGGKIDRRRLLQNLHVPSMALRAYINDLIVSERIEAYDENGRRDFPTHSSREIYQLSVKEVSTRRNAKNESKT